MDAEAYFSRTRQFCLEQVGEEIFYRHFRVDNRSFRDDPFSEVFTIRYRFYPPGLEVDSVYVNMIFQRLDFLGVTDEVQPAYLPPCVAEPGSCYFPVTRDSAIVIARQEVLRGRALELAIYRLSEDYTWSGVIMSDNGGYREDFSVDARTGKVIGIDARRRID
jgi:hypothetical protein